MFPPIPGYDVWKMAAPNQDAPPLDGECEWCGEENYQENLVGDLCEDCVSIDQEDPGERDQLIYPPMEDV